MIVQLRDQGWTLRRIGADHRVRMSHVGVQKVLDRTAANFDDDGYPLLDLWRAARGGKDELATSAMNLYRRLVDERRGELAMQRYGLDLVDLDFGADRELRKEAGDQVYDELSRRPVKR